MRKINCFDVVSEVVSEAGNQFSPTWKIKETDYKILEQYCQYIDRLADEFEAEYYAVEVCPYDKTVSISVETPDISICEKEHYFFSLIKRTVRFGFSSSENGSLLTHFVFPRLWERVSELPLHIFGR